MPTPSAYQIVDHSYDDVVVGAGGEEFDRIRELLEAGCGGLKLAGLYESA